MSAQPGASQDDYNPFTDEGAKKKELVVKEVVSTISYLAGIVQSILIKEVSSFTYFLWVLIF